MSRKSGQPRAESAAKRHLNFDTDQEMASNQVNKNSDKVNAGNSKDSPLATNLRSRSVARAITPKAHRGKNHQKNRRRAVSRDQLVTLN